MFLQKNRFEERIISLEAEIVSFQALKASMAQLETQLSSLRGQFNAKLGGMAVKQTAPPKQKDMMADLTQEQKEFVAGLPPWEVERLNKSETDE